MPFQSDYNKLNRLYRCQREGKTVCLYLGLQFIFFIRIWSNADIRLCVLINLSLPFSLFGPSGRFHHSHLGYSGPSPRWFQENGFNISAIVPPPPPRDAYRRRIRAGSKRLQARAKIARSQHPASDSWIPGFASLPWFRNRSPTQVPPILTLGKRFGAPASAPVFRDPGSELNRTTTSYTKNSTVPQAVTVKPQMSESSENPYFLIDRDLANDKNNTASPELTAAPPVPVKSPEPTVDRMPNLATAPLGSIARQDPQKLDASTRSPPARQWSVSRNRPWWIVSSNESLLSCLRFWDSSSWSRILRQNWQLPHYCLVLTGKNCDIWIRTFILIKCTVCHTGGLHSNCPGNFSWHRPQNRCWTISSNWNC